MVGPPLTMLLIAEELLTVSQEVQAGILVPSILKEPCTATKKRKFEQEQRSKDTERGESSVHQDHVISGQESSLPQQTSKHEFSIQQGTSLPPRISDQQTLVQKPTLDTLPTIEVALAQPNQIGGQEQHSCVSSKVLHEILENLKHTSSSMERNFQEWSDSTPKKLLEALKNQQIRTEEQIKASTSHKLEQALAEMRADNGKLQEKI